MDGSAPARLQQPTTGEPRRPQVSTLRAGLELGIGKSAGLMVVIAGVAIAMIMAFVAFFTTTTADHHSKGEEDGRNQFQ